MLLAPVRAAGDSPSALFPSRLLLPPSLPALLPLPPGFRLSSIEQEGSLLDPPPSLPHPVSNQRRSKFHLTRAIQTSLEVKQIAFALEAAKESRRETNKTKTEGSIPRLSQKECKGDSKAWYCLWQYDFFNVCKICITQACIISIHCDSQKSFKRWFLLVLQKHF